MAKCFRAGGGAYSTKGKEDEKGAGRGGGGGRQRKRIVEGTAVDEERKSYLLA